MCALASWLPFTGMAAAMAYIPAILIVLTLTGEPVANALCIKWCDIPSERQHCGEAIAQSASEISLPSSACVVLSAGPFLREEGRSALFNAVALETAHAVDIGVTQMGLLHLRASGAATPGRPLPPLVLRV